MKTLLLSIKGRAELELRRGGKLLLVGKYDNLVVTSGKDMVAAIFLSLADTRRISHAALGDDNSAPDISQTTLVSEIAGAWVRAAVSSSSVSGRFTTFNFVWTATAGPNTIREIGLFTDVAAGTMFARFLPFEFQMISGDVLSLGWTVDFGGDN